MRYDQWFDEEHKAVILSYEGIPFYKVWIEKGTLQTEIIHLSISEMKSLQNDFYHEDGSCGI